MNPECAKYLEQFVREVIDALNHEKAHAKSIYESAVKSGDRQLIEKQFNKVDGFSEAVNLTIRTLDEQLTAMKKNLESDSQN